MEKLTAAAGALTAAREGRGRDLVFVHSLLTDRRAFDPALPELASRFCVTMPNLPGFHGAKPVSASLEAYATWLRQVVDAFAIGRAAILMGNRLGGTGAAAVRL